MSDVLPGHAGPTCMSDAAHDQWTPVIRWDKRNALGLRDRAVDLLEAGHVLWLADRGFAPTLAERSLLTPATSDGRAKNISFDVRRALVSGSALHGDALAALGAMLARFAHESLTLVHGLFPDYNTHIEQGLVSFRPVGVEGRASSVRKDDTRLHVDAFTSRPNRGRRILRVFTNLNPHGVPRVWHVGEPFETYAQHFLPTIGRYSPLAARWLQRLHLTKSLRSEYDHLMLGLHDHGKMDEDWQRTTDYSRFEFPPGSTWICYPDQVLHAALSGQYMMEQTYYLPVAAMAWPERSPLKVLERLKGHALT